MQRRLVLLALAALAALAALPALAAAATPTLVQVGTFAAPIYVTSPPLDTSRVYVVERAGTIREIKDGVRQPTPFLDITGQTTTDGERGLLSVAFAPDYATSGRFYIYYTNTAGNIQIDEYRRSATNPEVADPTTRRPIVTIAHPGQNNHNGGQLAFGPDGMLYAGTGDGGGAGDPTGNAQKPTAQLGKMLRINVTPGAATAPADNPFIPSGGDGLVWSIGLRNPFRFSFDRLTGDLAIGDVGQDKVEEVDFAPKASGLGRGGNYGWNLIEGNLTYPGGQPATAFPPAYIPPVITHDHASGWCSIIGGYVLRDAALPELAGRYIYSDLCNGIIYSATLTPSGAVGDGPIPGLPKVNQIDSFGEDGCGRLYVVSLNGPVYRLSTSGACAGPAPVPFVTAPVPGAAPISAPGTGPTAPGGAVVDRRAPVLKVQAAAKQRALRHGYVQVSASCDELCTVRARAKLNLSGRARKAEKTVPRLVAQPVRRSLAAGARVQLRLPLTKPTRRAIRAALASGRAAFATVTVVATDRAGNAKTTTTKVRIVR